MSITADTDQDDDIFAAERAAGMAQAARLKQQAEQGGLRFEAYLPPHLATWLLELVERGVFLSPSEAVFVIMGEHQELSPHADLRQELLKRQIEAAINDPRPSLSSEEVFAELKAMMAKPRPEPAEWVKGI
jgi:antitoxin ParD1/3/4